MIVGDGFEESDRPESARIGHGRYDRLLAEFAATGWACAEVDLPVKVDSLYASIARALNRIRKENPDAYPGLRIQKANGVVRLHRVSETAACGGDSDVEVAGLRRVEEATAPEPRLARGRYETMLREFEALHLASAKVTLPGTPKALHAGIAKVLLRARQKDARAFRGIHVVNAADGVYLVRDA